MHTIGFVTFLVLLLLPAQSFAAPVYIDRNVIMVAANNVTSETAEDAAAADEDFFTEDIPERSYQDPEMFTGSPDEEQTSSFDIPFETHYSPETELTAEDITQEVRYLMSLDGRSSGIPFNSTVNVHYDFANDELFILDNQNSRVLVMDPEGSVLHHFYYASAGLGSLQRNLVITNNGDMILSDGYRISQLNYRGVFIKDLDTSFMSDDEGIQSLYFDDVEEELYVGTTKALYVLDSLDSKGNTKLKLTATSKAPFKNVSSVVVLNGEIFILDPPSFKVFRFNRNGKFLSSFGHISGLAGGFSMPVDMTVDRIRGYVAVLDINRFALMFYDQTGQFIFEFGGDNTLPRPVSVALDKRGRMYISVNTKKVRVFEFLRKEFDKQDGP